MDTTKNLLFICTGNICRSPAAQAVMQRLVDERGLTDRYRLDSAGTYSGHAGQRADRRMREHAARRGYDLTHVARSFDLDDIDRFHYIVVMDSDNEDYLRRRTTHAEFRRVVPLGRYLRHHPRYDHVPDPYYGDGSDFELALDLLEDGCAGLLDALENGQLD